MSDRIVSNTNNNYNTKKSKSNVLFKIKFGFANYIKLKILLICSEKVTFGVFNISGLLGSMLNPALLYYIIIVENKSFIWAIYSNLNAIGFLNPLQLELIKPSRDDALF